MLNLDELPRAELVEMLGDFARNWLAHDGLWFQAVERAHGLEEAIELDTEAWRRFSPIEARRIAKRLGLPEAGGGLEALRKALGHRMYAVLNRQTSELEDGRLRFYMEECRVQDARRRKGLPDFPCEPVGLVEYGTFAETIDPRIRTRCIACQPDEGEREFACGWEFWLEGTGGDG